MSHLEGSPVPKGHIESRTGTVAAFDTVATRILQSAQERAQEGVGGFAGRLENYRVFVSGINPNVISGTGLVAGIIDGTRRVAGVATSGVSRLAGIG